MVSGFRPKGRVRPRLRWKFEIPVSGAAFCIGALAVSAQTGEGLDELWDLAQQHQRALSAAGVLEEKRRAQRARWMWNALEEMLMDAFRDHPDVAAQLEAAQNRVRSGEQTPEEAAEGLLGRFLS